MDRNKIQSLSESTKIQEIFLNHCRKNRIEVVLDGHSKEGRGYIVGFDSESIVIDNQGRQMLFYKSALSSVRPLEEVNFIFNDSWRQQNDLHYHVNSPYLN